MLRVLAVCLLHAFMLNCIDTIILTAQERSADRCSGRGRTIRQPEPGEGATQLCFIEL